MFRPIRMTWMRRERRSTEDGPRPFSSSKGGQAGLFSTYCLHAKRWELPNFSICMTLSSHWGRLYFSSSAVRIVSSSMTESVNVSRCPGIFNLCSTKLWIVFKRGDRLTSLVMQRVWYCPFGHGPWSSLRDLYIDGCGPTSVSLSNVEQNRKEHSDGVSGQHSTSNCRRLGNKYFVRQNSRMDPIFEMSLWDPLPTYRRCFTLLVYLSILETYLNR